MTEHEHDWGEWERTYELVESLGVRTRRLTGGSFRECRTCGQWEVEWGEDEETK